MTASPEGLRRDPVAWDAFVEAAPTGAYPQLSAWADVKRRNGWRAERIVVDGAAGPVGVQLLVRDLRPTPWRIGYGPRGPVGAAFDPGGIAALSEALRERARKRRIVEIVMDPEVEAGDPLVAALDRSGWRPTRSIQADRTRLVDLRRSEDELWGDLRSKWRQYVSKARRAGVQVEEAGAGGLDAFYDIYVETAQRAGFVHRSKQAYVDVFQAFDRAGRARLLLARAADGAPVAALMLVACGPRVVEPYGGMTEAGAESRANYLLKWEAIRSSKERGYATYDMWGLAHPGIERFKSGFGGRDVAYSTPRTLVVDRFGQAAVTLARRAMITAGRLRQRVASGRGGPAVTGADGAGDAT